MRIDRKRILGHDMDDTEHWLIAQKNERKHWEGFIANCMKDANPETGYCVVGERFWLDLWDSQAGFLWPIINELKKVTPKTRILEIGGGAVGIIRWFDEGQLFALDPLGELFESSFPHLPLSEYALRGDVKYIAKPIEGLGSARAGRFDIVLMLDCLDHCRVPEEALRAIHKALKAKGVFFESTTAFKRDMALSPEYLAHHPWGWTAEELVELIEAQGFELLRTEKTWPVHPGFREPNSNSDQQLHIWSKAR